MLNNEIRELYKTLNILCVEDDEFVAESYKDMFTLMFNKVFIAYNGLEGLEYFENEHIDIVLSDYKMPLCNGFEMSQKIRQKDATIPIIIVTALESLEMLRGLIDVNITSFLKKPLTMDSMHAAFNLAVKSIIAERLLVQKQMQELLYSNYQEELTYAKEKKIIKNELGACRRILSYTCGVFYQPKDTLSGDSYLIKHIEGEDIFTLIVDGMGKGISASVTAMMCSAFVNYKIEELKKQRKFCLQDLIRGFLDFIQANLLEDEVVSAKFVFFEKEANALQYATFSMPPILYMLYDDHEVYKIRSNNPPIAEYTQTFQINTFSLQKVEKLLFYSDGLNENGIKNSSEIYHNYLKEDFQKAHDYKKFEILRKEKVEEQEDDITYMFLSSLKGK